MPNFPESGISLVADLTDYSRNINQAIDEAGQLESKLADLSSVDLDADVAVSVDIDDADFSTLESDLDTFGASEYTAEASAEVDDSQIAPFEETLETVDETDAEASASADVDDQPVTDFETELTDLDEMSSEAEATADVDDTGLTELETELTTIDQTSAEAEVSVDTPDPAADETIGLLKDIRAGVMFTLLLNVAGTILDVFNRIESFTVAPILDVQEGVARFNAQTGEAVDGMDELINRLHFGDVGDFGPIVDTLVAAQQQGIEFGEGMEEAAAGALEITKVFSDQNPVEVLRTMNQLVQAGLVPDFETASDVLIAGLQEGNNRGGDMLQTLNQFAPMFSEMGIDAQEAMSLFSSGLDAGFRSTSDIARAIDTMNKNITGAAADSPVAEALESIGVELPAQGEQVGEDFFNSVIEGIRKNPEAADTAIEAIFGGRADKVSEAFGELTLADDAFEHLEDRAEDAATVIDDHLRGAFDDFILWIQQTINELLSSAEIDLPGKLEELKSRLQDALAAIQSGAGFGEALEVALQVPGLNDTFSRIESGFGNFEIVLLQVVSALANLLGQGDIATSAGTEAARLGQQQLAFDLKLATTPEEVRTMVDLALSRGVTGEGIGAAFEVALTELAQSGDIPGFSALAHAIEEASGVELTNTITDMLQGALDTALASGDLDVAQQVLDQAALEGVGDQMRDTLVSGISEAMAAGNFEDALDIANMLGEENMITAVQEMADEVGTQTDAMAAATEEAGDRVGEANDAAGQSFGNLAIRAYDAIFGKSIVPDVQAMADSVIPNVNETGAAIVNMGALAAQGFGQASYWALAVANSFGTLGNTLPILQGINAELTAMAGLGTAARQVMESIPTTGGGAGNTTNNTTNINMNQTNNVQSQAQSASVGAATSRQIRGLAA